MRLQCSECGKVHEVSDFAYKQTRKAGLSVYCKGCDSDLHETGEPVRRGRTDNQKRSRAQEKRAAKRYGARTQPASGSMSGAKGDIRDPGRLRGECKFTRAKSYSLKLAELKKLESEASAGEMPVFEIEFQGEYPHRRYVVLPGWFFDSLTGDQE